jgi:hypothetical protein
LIKLLRRNNITIRGFLKIYPELFVVRAGMVRLLTVAAGAEAEAEAEPEPVAPEPVRRRLTLVGGDDARVGNNMAEALRLQGRQAEEDVRLQRARERVRFLPGAYPG